MGAVAEERVESPLDNDVHAASYGLQAEVQTFAYVMVLMTDRAVEHIETGDG